MDLGNTVDVAAHINAQVCHIGGVIIHNKQAGMLGSQLGINAANNVHDLRHNAAEQIQIPFLQGLAHNCVVGVGEGFLGNGKALFEVHTLQHQQPDQFGNGHCRVGVVQLDAIELGKVAHICAVRGLIDPQNILQGCA